MYRRHDEVPVYERRAGHLAARHVNRARVALGRLGGALRLPLPDLRHLELIVQDDAWIIVDNRLDDLPVAAWTDFAIAGRSSLHEPVACELRLFHAHATLILDRVLDTMDAVLDRELEALAGGDGPRIIPL